MRKGLLPISESAVACFSNAGWVGGQQPALGRKASVKKDEPAELIFLSEYRQKRLGLFYRKVAFRVVNPKYILCGDGF